MKQTLEKLYAKLNLTQEEAKALLLRLLDPSTPHVQIAAVLSCFRMRPVTLEELMGFREGALEGSVKLDFGGIETVDVCGTGGDNKNTFNISTISAIVCAAAGLKVTKHGGAAVSSKVGSSNLLEALGYKFTSDSNVLKKQLEKTGLCFLHAPLFLPAFKHAAPARKELGVKTIFNILGPVLNPSSPAFQTLGVYGLDVMRMYSYLGQKLNKKFSILHTLDGCDEVSLTSEVKVSDPEKENVYLPRDFGMDKITYAEIKEGENVEDSVRIFTNVLDGKGTPPQMNVVYANAGLTLYQVGKLKGSGESLLDSVDKAKEAVVSGKAKEVFKGILELNAS